MSTSVTGGGLHFDATIDDSQFQASLNRMTNDLKRFNSDIQKQGIELDKIGKRAGSGFDTKPLTEYQKEQLVIKQGFLDLAKKKAEDAAAEKKAKQEQAAADKVASVVLQNAIREERLVRQVAAADEKRQKQEAANLAKEQLALQKQITAEANKKKTVSVTNDPAINTKINSSGLYGNVIKSETVSRSLLNTELAKTAALNNDLVFTGVKYVSSINTQSEATKKNTLTKREQAQAVAEEKLRLSQSTAELKNNAREMLNAKGSLEQRRAALIRLNTVYDRLSVTERNSASGTRMANIIKGVTDQVKQLEAATGRSQRNVGNYPNGFGKLGNDAATAAGRIVELNNKLKFFQDALTRAKAPESFVNLNRKIEETKNSLTMLGNAGKKGFDTLGKKNDIEQLRASLSRLAVAYSTLSKAERESAAGNRMSNMMKGLKDQIKGIEDQANSSSGGIAGFFEYIKNNIVSTLGPIALLTAAWQAAKAVFSHNVEISDNFTDVQRTAKLSGEEVDKLGDKLKKINTRTSLEGLLDIGFEGGRLGVAKNDLVDFITTVDKLAVVLKKELPGGAEAVAESLGKIVKIYKISENEGLSMGDAMNKVGSSLLELAHSGGVTVKYLQDFTLGVAGTAVSAKLSLPVIEAYGAVMSTAGTIASSASISLTRVVNDLSTKRGKYYAIAQLADSTLTVEKFNNLINTDTQAALALFFKGLKAGNPTQIEFNDRIKSVGITTGKVSNAVKVLANNFDLLDEKLAIGTKGYKDATSVSHNFELANNSLAASFDKIKSGIVNFFTSSSNGRGLALLLNSFTDNRTEAEKLAEAYQENKHKSEELDTALNPLKKKYDELTKKGKLNRDEQTELRDVIAKIGDLVPDVITKFNQYNKALEINRGKVEEATGAQKKLLEMQNRTAISAAQFAFKNTTEELKQANSDRGKKPSFGRVVYEAFRYGSPKSDPQRKQENDDLILKLADEARQEAENLKAMGVKLTKAQQDAIDAFKTPVKVKPAEITGTGELADETEIARSTDVIKGEIKALKDANKSLAITSDDFKANVKKINALKKELKLANGGKDTDVTKEETRLKSAYSRAKSLSDKMIDLTAASVRKSKSADQEELDSVSDKYAKMRKEVEDFYSKTENKGAKIKIDGKNVSQSQALGILKTNEKIESDNKKDTQAAKKQLEALDIEKKQYEEYESYKSAFGEQMANQRYAKELKTNKTYLQRLQDETAKIEAIPESDRTGVQVDQLTELNKRKNEAVFVELQKNDEIFKQVQTSLEKEKNLDAKYLKDKKAILAEEAVIGKAKTEARVLLLNESYEADANNLRAAELEKSKIYRDAAEEAMLLTRQQTIKQIAALQQVLSSIDVPADQVEKIQKSIGSLKIRLKIGADEGNLDALKDEYKRVLAQLSQTNEDGTKKILSAKDYKEITERLAGIQLKINDIINPKSGKAKSTFSKGLEENFAYLKGSTKEFAEGASRDLGELSGGFNELSGALGGNNTQAGYLLGTIGDLAAAGADAAGAFASFSSGDIIGGITKTIGAVTKILGIGKKVKEMNAAARKEVEDFYANAIKGEREYQDLLKERELQSIRNNKIALQGIRDEVALRKQQIAEYKKESDEIMAKLQGQSSIASEEYKHGTWFRKAEVKKTYESLAGKKFSELSDLLAQGKLEGDTKALVERLKELEQKGYDAEKVIADLAKETSELFTGTTSSSLTDTLADMFKNGKTSAKDLADFFKQSMDDAALSIFKNKVLSGAMQKFYEEFDKAAQSGDELTSDEIDRLNGLFTSLTDDALKKFEDFKKITGSDLKGGEGTSSVGNIRAELTEQTGGKLEGLWRGQYDLTKSLVAFSAERNEIIKPIALTQLELLNIARQKLDVAIRNEQNTFRTANNTDSLSAKLDQIISNTKPSVTARGAGI